MNRPSIAIACVLALVACSDSGAPPPEPIQSSAQSIIRGERERGQDAVVMLYFADGRSGGMCTGTIIAPRVVLTAKHCTQGWSPADFTVAVGPNPFAGAVAFYGVSEIRTTEGGALDGRDIAVLILDEDAAETPFPLSADQPVRGRDVTLIGYGQTESSDGGTKYRAVDTVTYVLPTEFVTDGHGACHGDSGGPTFDADMRVTGVMVRADCEGSTIHTRVDAFLEDLIYPAMRDTGVCVPTGDGVESCNGIDDDCDGQTDEVCQPLGADCVDDSSCLEGTCVDVPTGARICTEPCDPFASACRDGFTCRRTGCGEGFCVPGGAGAKSLGDACGDDGECASLHCVDPGDGTRRCLSPCQDGEGDCDPGDVCGLENGGSCGGCVSGAGRTGPFGHGETCATATDCRGGTSCIDDEGAMYCARSCAGGEACPDGSHCRAGSCVRGGLEPDGDPCVGNEDCQSGVCASQGDASFCTSSCSAADPCGAGLTCAPAGGITVCAPTLVIVGQRCEASTDCMSGLCASGVCTRLCGHDVADCPSGTTCLPVAGDGTRACTPNRPLPAETDDDGGGCSAANGASTGTSLMGTLAMLAFVFALGRRRRRRD